MVALGEDGHGLGVVSTHASESTSADFFLAVVEEAWVVDDGEDGIGANLSAFNCNLGSTFESSLILSGYVLCDRDGEEIALAIGVSDGLHVHHLKELKLVHEALERACPSITDSLEVLDLMSVNVEDGERSELGSLSCISITPHGLSDNSDVVVAEDTLGAHVVHNHRFASLDRKLTSVDVHFRVLWRLIRVRDTSEVLDDASAGLSIKSLDITSFANFKTGTDVTLKELETSFLMDLSNHVSACTVG